MAQEPSSKDLLEAVKQQESGGRRYKADGKTLLEGPMTKYGTAKGEMQVLDMTTKDPGYGVRPARDDSADERARVGRDYLAAMVKKYGDRQTALVAYNWGPGNTDKWLQKGGDFSKLPAETQNYVAKITGSLGGTKVAKAETTTPTSTPKSGIQRAVYKAAPLTHPMLSQLGPNYQAAMAVSMLADEAEKEGKSEYEPSEAEKMLTEATARPVALASADLGFQSPFPTPVSSAPAKQQLQAFSHGGAVHMADGGDLDYFQDPLSAPSAPITADTFAKGKDFKAADALQATKEVGKGAVRAAKNIARGVTEVPYDIAGAPVDIATMAMRPFGYSVEAPVGGSDWLKKQALEAGIRQAPPTDPRDLGFYTMGELGSSIVNPGPIAAKVGQATEKAVTTGGKAVAREMLRGMEGQGVLAPVSPQGAIMYAVKPRGGTSLTSGSLDKPAISKIDKTIEQWFDRAVQEAPDAESTQAIREFLDKKARKYLINEFGTGADPIRKAISSGEIAPVGTDVERFPEYLLHAARTPEAPGHAQARRDLERVYDRGSTIEGTIVGLHDPADADARRLFNQSMEQAKQNAQSAMALEGVPRELQNLIIKGSAGSDLEASYNSGLRSAIENPQEFPSVAGAVQRGQPIYDLSYNATYMDMFSPKHVAENLSVLPANKLKNMSFDDAMIEGSKRMAVYRDYDKAVDLMAKGAAVPKEVLTMYTKPVLQTDKGQWVQLTDKIATKMEGKMLHHSVGSYATSSSYGHGGKQGFDTGAANVFSLRDPKTGLAKVTLEAAKLDDGSLMFSQHKGNFNSFPESSIEDAFKLFDKLGKDKNISFSKYPEGYPNDPTGTPLPRPVYFDWGKEYQHWKDTGKLPPIPSAFGGVLPPPPSQVNIPPFAKGGMVERQPSTAKYI